MAIHGKLGAKLASGVGLVYFASANNRMERSILRASLIITIGLVFPLQIMQRCVRRFPRHQHGNPTHIPTVPWSPILALVLTGASVICKHPACLREHGEYSNIQILQAKKKLNTILSKHFLYRLPIFLPFVFAFL